MTQKESVLQHLKVYGTITPLEALRAYNSFRLSDIIFKLRGEGYSITTTPNEGKKKYAIYKMEVKHDQQ